MNAPIRKTSHSYFVVMQDYGKRGLEAVVHPETTRIGIVDMIMNGEFKHVAFIHHIDGLYIEDVTDELFEAAEALRGRPNAADALAAKWDHAADHSKHGVV
jgi:hypothetical protein